MNTEKKNTNHTANLKMITEPPDTGKETASEILGYLENLLKRVKGVESLLDLILTSYESNLKLIAQAEKSILYKIEVKVDNLHRIFELASNKETEKIGNSRRYSTKHSRKEDLTGRKEREMARTLLSLKKSAIQS